MVTSDEEKQTIVVRSETLVWWPVPANQRSPLSPRTNKRQGGGQGLGSRGSDCWHPENWCPATRSGDTAETPPAMPGLSVLCSVQPQPMSDHRGSYSQKDVRVEVHHNFVINLSYKSMPILTFKLHFAPRGEADPLFVWLWCRIRSHLFCSPHVLFCTEACLVFCSLELFIFLAQCSPWQHN